MNRIESYSRKAMWPVAIALAAFIVAGCGSSSDSAPAATTPVVDPVGAVCVGAECVNLATAGNYVILAKDGGITNVSPSVVTGHVGMNAVAAGMTGFSLVMDASNTFATSTQVTGRMYASDYAAPTPAALTQAIADTGAAFTDASNSITRPVGIGNTDLGVAGNITGLVLPAGVYEWNSGVSVDAASTVTLTGSATDVWVLRIAGGVTMNPGSSVTLAGGALPQNVFWRTAGVVALDTTANLKGIVLSSSSVTMENGASVNGRLFASTAVTLIANTVTRPPL
jgi:hypothetical protein